MYNKIKHIHLIGIGGIGMSGIAELLLRNGYVVSGSDRQRNEVTARLEKLGATLFLGHDPNHLKETELVVHSTAIATENPEMQAARERAIPTIPRAEMLAELMRLKYGIAVAGAHGKTTTTSMIATVLTQTQFDPTIVVGGRMDNFGGTNARLGNGDFMVVEADESDGSFNKLSPAIAVVTNLDREHMDFYKSLRGLRQAFATFLDKIPFYGLSLLCGDDPQLRLIEKKLTRRNRTFGFSNRCDYQIQEYQATKAGSTCQLRLPSGQLAVLELQVPGRHNALNALAALAVADELSVSPNEAIQALNQYQGVQRRFQKRGTKQGVLFIDDYAHHPTEIEQTLQTARESYPEAQIHAILQPHRYSRVEDLIDEFATPFRHCTSVAVLPIYSAGESPIAGIDATTLEGLIRNQGVKHACAIETPMEAVDYCLRQSGEGDVILTLGAGDLPRIYRELF